MSWLDDIRGLATSNRSVITADQAVPGRSNPMPVAAENAVLHAPMVPPFGRDAIDNGVSGSGFTVIYLAGGCFWGIEEIFWGEPGVISTAVGYAGGFTANPTYEQVCTGRTGHTETTLVAFDPATTTLENLLATFWQSHDPTLGMRQGNDVGTQYRSAIFATTDPDLAIARHTAEVYGGILASNGLDPITTEISLLADAGDGNFYYAEDNHQQYLHKNPNGYRCHSSTGLKYPLA